MDAWVVWVIIAAAFAVGEMLTTALYLAPFAVGAAAAAAASAAGAGEAVPWLLFAGIGVLLLFAFRPIARSHRHMPPQIRTGTAALVGRPGYVVEALTGPQHTGSVKIDGEVWTARAYDGEDIPAGRQVHIIEIKGAMALVSE
jgi:membrane protein implicated in regulation of membrane protease activity